MRLGTWLPFERVPRELAFFCQATVSIETARRWTEGAGAALVAAQTQEVERLERESPAPPTGPEVQQLSVDGAMVPLVGGEWTEVKTLALGTVGQRVTKEGETVAHTTNLSYFSRLAEAQEFRRLALVATHPAGTETAGTVCAVSDGAEWVQGFIDFHRSDAVRISGTRLRVFPPAAEHVNQAAQAVLGAGSPAATTWLDQQLIELKTGDPDQVLGALTTLAQQPEATAEAQATCDEVIAYLRKRREQIAYATFRQAGYPIGDGIVESANKLVVEARLKGSGMRWERSNVNPMVALRACACSDQWESGWTSIAAGLRQQERVRRQTRHQDHHQEQQPPVPLPSPEAAAALPSPSPPPSAPSREKLVVDGRPTKDHPWHRFRLAGSHRFSDRAKP